MATDGDTPRAASVFQRWFDSLNERLFPWLGPPPLGPYDEEPARPVAERSCPLCGHPMSEHEIDRSGERTQLYCPAR